MMNYIAHYGKGHDDNPPGRGSGRYPYGSKIIKKGSNLYRYSNKKETSIKDKTYVSYTRSDVGSYFDDSINARLGFKDYKKIYLMKLPVTDTLKVKKADSVLKDICNLSNNKKLNNAYNKLEEAGYFSTDSVYKRLKIWKSSKELQNARALLASNMNALLYGDTDSKSVINSVKNKQNEAKSLLDKYKSEGYDLIVDPEDYVWNYQMPMILLNSDKLNKPISKVVFNHSLKDYPDDKRIEASDQEWSELWKYVNEK